MVSTVSALNCCIEEKDTVFTFACRAHYGLQLYLGFK